MAGCPSSHQPTRIREETLESGGPLQRKLNFCLRTILKHKSMNNLITLVKYAFLYKTVNKIRHIGMYTVSVTLKYY